MGPWDGNIKKEKEEEDAKQVISKKYFFHFLSISILEEFFGKYTKLLVKADREDDVILDKNRIITEFLNQTLVTLSIKPEGKTNLNNIKLSSIKINSRYFFIFNDTCVQTPIKLSAAFNNLFIVYQFYRPNDSLFSLLNNNVPPPN